MNASELSLDYIRNYYKVPAEEGRIVEIDGERGVIIGGRNSYIKVLLDKDEPGQHSAGCYHPTCGVEYLGIGRIRVKKLTRSQKNYQDFLDRGLGYTFPEWMGWTK